jgi:glycosyltransferase 2 family protein
MKKKFLIFSLGIAISGIFLLIALQQVEWSLFVQALGGVDAKWLMAAWVFLLLGVGLRTARWNVISGKGAAFFSSFWQAVNLGYLGNMILPARAGEILRMAAIHRLASLPHGFAISSAVADRLFDGLSMGLFLIVVFSYHGQGIADSMAMIWLAFFFVFLGMLLTGFIRYGDKLPANMKKILHGFSWTDRIRHWYGQAFEGSQVLRNPRRLWVIVWISLAAFMADILMLFMLLTSFGWELPFMAAVSLAVFLVAGSSLPSAPGYVGIYQVACVLALRLFHVDASGAVALSVVLQMLLLSNFLFFGGIAFFQHRSTHSLR